MSLTGLLLGLGVGLCGYYGQAWWELPRYTDADIEASVEINLQRDLHRLGPNLQPDATRLAQLRTRIRTEIEGELRRERERIQLRFGIGLLALVLGLGQLAGERSRRQNAD